MITRETLLRLEFDKILAEIADQAHCEVTRGVVMAMTPLSDAEQIRLVADRIGELRSLISLGIPLRLTGFEDIRPLLELVRPAGAFLAPQDLLRFIPVLEIFDAVSRQLSICSDIPALASLAPPLSSFPEILEPLAASIDHDGSVKESASVRLGEIRRAKRALSARIRKKIEEIVRDNGIEQFLQDDFITQRSGRWVIPVRMDSKGMVRGVVHDVSASGETAFMEPLEIIPFVNELENVSAEEKAEEIRILRQLSAWIREDAAPLEGCFATLVTLDGLNGMARFAERYALESPRLNNDGVLRLTQARHPLLLMLLRQGALSHVQPLDLEMGDTGRVMVITGPNAGGKTIALKTAGVLTLMALCAIPVPCNGARSTFPLLDALLVDIGDEQSIEQSLSTFSAHVSRIVAILGLAGPRTLVLLDELGAGTEPQQGAAIACGVLRELQERGATVIATTHLSEIIGFVHRTPGMINAGMEYDADTYTPLYRLISGEPGHSHAVEIALRYGMPEQVIAFAREMVGSGGAEFTSLLADLHRKRDQLVTAQREVERQQEMVRKKQQEVEARASAIVAARREAADKAWGEARELISETRRKMNGLLEEFKREKRNEIIEKLRNSETELMERLKPERAVQDDNPPLQEVAAGDRVQVRSLGHDGVVLSVDQRQGKVRVRVGSMELDVGIDDLTLPGRQGEEKGRRPGFNLRSTEQAEKVEQELKLIGMRVDEALDLLEPFLNHASLNGLSEVRIIHGVGTGRLRDAVREHLCRHPLVEEFRPGGQHEGRDGATVALLRQ